jgi:DNA-binding NarL/FixJ family response regulator
MCIQYTAIVAVRWYVGSAMRPHSVAPAGSGHVRVVLVVDQHGVYRHGLCEMLKAHIEPCRVVGVSTCDQMGRLDRVDLVLIDEAGLTEDAPALLREVRALGSDTRFAVLSISRDRRDVLNCLAAGFHGFISKQQIDEEILAAVDDLLSGRIVVPAWLAGADENTAGQRVAERAGLESVQLTPRQNEILPLLASGMSNKEIGRVLGIAEATVKIHAAGLVRALRVRNRSQAASLAAQIVRTRIDEGRVSRPQFIQPSTKRYEPGRCAGKLRECDTDIGT